MRTPRTSQSRGREGTPSPGTPFAISSQSGPADAPGSRATSRTRSGRLVRKPERYGSERPPSPKATQEAAVGVTPETTQRETEEEEQDSASSEADEALKKLLEAGPTSLEEYLKEQNLPELEPAPEVEQVKDKELEERLAKEIDAEVKREFQPRVLETLAT